MLRFAYGLPVKSLETIPKGPFLIITSNTSFNWEIHSSIHKRDEEKEKYESQIG